MRNTLRFLPAVLVLATLAATFASSIACGPRDLFLGAFTGPDSTPDAPEGIEPPDSQVPDAPPFGGDSTSCDPALDASTVTITAFQNAGCRSCALSACCSEVTACFAQNDAAGASCTTYAECIDQCRVHAKAPDAGPPLDASNDGGGPDCEAECSFVGRPALYSALETCLVGACACPYF